MALLAEEIVEEWLNRNGQFTSEEYEVEQQLVRELILSEIENGKIHLNKYLEEWNRLKAKIK